MPPSGRAGLAGGAVCAAGLKRRNVWGPRERTGDDRRQVRRRAGRRGGTRLRGRGGVRGRRPPGRPCARRLGRHRPPRSAARRAAAAARRAGRRGGALHGRRDARGADARARGRGEAAARRAPGPGGSGRGRPHRPRRRPAPRAAKGGPARARRGPRRRRPRQPRRLARRRERAAPARAPRRRPPARRLAARARRRRRRRERGRRPGRGRRRGSARRLDTRPPHTRARRAARPSGRILGARDLHAAALRLAARVGRGRDGAQARRGSGGAAPGRARGGRRRRRGRAAGARGARRRRHTDPARARRGGGGTHTTPVEAAVDRGLALDLLRRMLEIPSPPYEERALAKLLVDAMTELGLDARIDPAGNVIGETGAGDGPSVYLVGHLGTAPGIVPAREDRRRRFRPGAADAKGPLAALVLAAAQAREAPGRIVVAGAVEEETPASRGAQHLVATLDPPDALIVGEPSGWSCVTLGYKGKVDVVYRVSRPATHPTNPAPKATEIAAAFWSDGQPLVEGWDRRGDDRRHGHAAFDRL